MAWIYAIISFAVGLCSGAVLFKQFRSDGKKVQELEKRLQDIQTQHDDYRDSVQDHFSTTATLLHSLSDSYREVYKHMADSAQNLCPGDVSKQLSGQAKAELMLTDDAGQDTQEEPPPTPPRDYAAKASDQIGSLSESYGLDNIKASNE